jgi:serine/threonine protein kinase
MSAAASASSGSPRLEKYELLEEIGHGGMATVYRARDPRLGRDVAVKLIHRHLRENAEVGTRFVAEARAAAKLRHPGIVEVFDVSNEDDPERYLVVELVRGTTLRKVLQAHRDMPAEVGAAIVLHLCQAVEHAHASAIVHRDIKPENVLVELPQDRIVCPDGAVETPPSPPIETRGQGDAQTRGQGDARTVGADANGAADLEGSGARPVAEVDDTQTSARDALTPRGLHAPQGRSVHRERPAQRARLVDAGVVIKITDFGIAKILDAQGVTSTGQVLGSPAHMAPEQIEGGEVDARTDVFALGVLLYECLVGHLPFEGKNPAQVLRRVLDGIYSPADRERPSVGGRWARLVAAALARDPAERTASAAQLAEQIQAELTALGVPDGRAEIAAYFADPAAYAGAHAGRLVARLTARGEAARKAGDVWGAAADWNRVLALAPDDLAILKRIGSLASSASRRILLRRAAMIVTGSVVLGVGAFAVARTMKARAAVHDPDPSAGNGAVDSASIVPGGAGALSATPEPLARAAATTSAMVGPIDTPAHLPRVAVTPGVPLGVAPPGPVASVRGVRFNIKPKGARLSVDGVARESWFTAALPLSVGIHSVEVSPTDKLCCEKVVVPLTVEAPPPGKPDEPQNVYLTMGLKPTGVSLAATAPPGARLFCPTLNVEVSPGVPVAIKLRDYEAVATCLFTAPGRPPRNIPVTFRAGESKTVPWPD